MKLASTITTEKHRKPVGPSMLASMSGGFLKFLGHAFTFPNRTKPEHRDLSQSQSKVKSGDYLKGGVMTITHMENGAYVREEDGQVTVYDVNRQKLEGPGPEALSLNETIFGVKHESCICALKRQQEQAAN